MRKKIILPDKEIADRLLFTSATIRSLAKEFKCSIQPICSAYRKHSTREQRLARKHEKQATRLRGKPNEAFAKWRSRHDVWTGRNHTNAARQKMSLAKKGKRPTLSQRKARSARLQGIAISEWRNFASTIAQRRKQSIEHKSWRQAVFKRDNYTCRECGLRSGQGKKVILHPHHIKPKSLFPQLMFELENGRTLCKECHHKTDTYGFKIKSLWRKQP